MNEKIFFRWIFLTILNYNEKGSIYTSISPLSLDLTGNNELALINLEVMNTYSKNITFNIK